ncbi:MAG: hypothetical protein JWR34_4806 [Mycobacterium sp.]|nr:hypothetical protein [Mycobacterium sp.]
MGEHFPCRGGGGAVAWSSSLARVTFRPALIKIAPSVSTPCPIAIAAHSITVAARAKIGRATNGLTTGGAEPPRTPRARGRSGTVRSERAAEVRLHASAEGRTHRRRGHPSNSIAC